MTTQKPNPSQEVISIVDLDDNVVDTAPRWRMREQGLRHRVTYLLVFNHRAQLLVQTRTKHKDWYPCFLDFAAGGVVLANESYEQSAERELAEELGITAALTPLFDIYFEDRATALTTKSWGRVFSCISEGPFKLQVEEVAATEFMDVETALEINRSLVTPDTRQVLLAYML